MRRLRVLRRLLVKYRAAGKIDKHLYHELYHLSKGNTFKHKRALVEHVRLISLHKKLMTSSLDPKSLIPLSTDPQGQGREGSRAGSQGGDGRQARKDQGRAREEAGPHHAEEAGSCCGRRGEEGIDWLVVGGWSSVCATNKMMHVLVFYRLCGCAGWRAYDVGGRCIHFVCAYIPVLCSEHNEHLFPFDGTVLCSFTQFLCSTEMCN